jgi:hypothetical protein
MPTIEQIEVHFATAELRVTKAGVKAEARAASIERIAYQDPLPDLLGYLQSQTELTRSTLVRILKGCGRLPESRSDARDDGHERLPDCVGVPLSRASDDCPRHVKAPWWYRIARISQILYFSPPRTDSQEKYPAKKCTP